jgi:DNA-directed RNA polymerase subunit M/transcription elongation factor TFIIS
MESMDQAEQFRERREHYSRMTEGELNRVAADIADLTPIAEEALKAEFAARGLKMEPPAPPPLPHELVVPASIDPVDDLVSVRTLHSESEAQEAKAILDSSFIASCLGPENIVDLENFHGSYEGGVEIKVFLSDSGRARAALASYAPQKEEDVPDDDEQYAVLCPKCHSREVVFEGQDIEAGATAAEAKLNWTCDDCGHKWQDEGIAEKL